MISFKKAVSMVVIFSLVLCSCSGTKYGLNGDNILRKVEVSYNEVGAGSGIEMEVMGQTMDERTDIRSGIQKIYKDCLPPILTAKNITCTNSTDGLKVDIEEVIINGWSYKGRNDLRCIFEDKTIEGCEPVPATCMTRHQTGNRVCAKNVVNVLIINKQEKKNKQYEEEDKKLLEEAKDTLDQTSQNAPNAQI